MPNYKEMDRNTWTVIIMHKTWIGQIKRVTKRDFATKREALQYCLRLFDRRNVDVGHICPFVAQ